jgi:hypothetical protein
LKRKWIFRGTAIVTADDAQPMCLPLFGVKSPLPTKIPSMLLSRPATIRSFATKTAVSKAPSRWRDIALRACTVLVFGLVFSTGTFLTPGASATETDYFSIRVVDKETGRGVPLVELRTVNEISFWTDSAGYIAIHEPGFQGETVYFHISSHGYEFQPDGFGYRGVRLKLESGGEATIKLSRKNIAQRLYRMTGAGIYRDSVLLGKKVPIKQPLLNAGVLGSDSVMTAVYEDRIHWFWGDTNLPGYPLGNYHTPGATSRLPADGGLNPKTGVNLEYFTDDKGFAKPTCKMPGDGPTWIEGVTVLGREASGQAPLMMAGYAKITPPLAAYERGIAVWNPTTQVFDHHKTFPDDAQAHPMGHPAFSEEDGAKYVYYCHPLPLVRVPADPSLILDPSQYETYTYILPESDAENSKLERDKDGKLVWRWRRDSRLPTRDLEERLFRENQISEHERAFRMDTAGSDRRWTLHTSTIAWNDYRKRWIMIGLEVGGENSFLGEVYYCEAEKLHGPWSPGVKIVTHDRYAFYNPRLHPMLTQDDGRTVFFEGTYTKTFSNAPQATPRYDYNQVMYQLDLSDPRLRPGKD